MSIALRYDIFGLIISPLLFLGLDVVQGFFEGNQSNFSEVYKNNLSSSNLFFIFLHFFFSSTFFLYFLSLTFSLNFLGTKHSLSGYLLIR